MTSEEDHKAIESVISRFNAGWQSGHLEIVRALMAEEVVFVAPGLGQEIKGREACLLTLQDYAKHAQTLVFDPDQPRIHIWGDTANLIFSYSIVYQVKEKMFQEEGKEVWTLIREAGKWVIAWRALVEYGPRETGSPGEVHSD